MCLAAEMCRPFHRADPGARCATTVRRCLLEILCVAVAILGLAAGAADAHEAGTTRVTASFAHDGTYAFALTTDASALLARLEIARRQPRSAPASPEEFQRGFDTFCDEVPKHLSIVFDDNQIAAPRVACLVDPVDPLAAESLSAIGVTVTLSGDVPRGAKTFRWKYDLTFASYAVTIRSADPRAEELTWLEGAEESPALAIARLHAPDSRWRIIGIAWGDGFTRIVPGGVEQILFVLGLFLLHPGLGRLLRLWSVFALGQMLTITALMWGRPISSPVWLHVPIALSIVFVAAWSLRSKELPRWSPALILMCGLAHGASLAGILRDPSLPSPPVSATAGLILGALTGELAILLGVAGLAGPWTYNLGTYRQSVVVPCATVLALMGMFWTVQTLMH
jgi:hypothetical protein